MASRITLPFWPSSLDCLKWSSDNIIAVGGGDQIGILTPRLQGPGPNGVYWNSTYFKANAFTEAEAPLLRPLTSDNFSVGEELSQRHVQALEWSPPGLARLGQCVLGVLSTNHVLSIWECDGRPDVGSNWKRKVVVNHTLISHYSKIERTADETDQLFEERKQVSQRVKAFAWGPQNQASDEEPSFPDGRRHFSLAVSTEAGEIILLRIQPPYDILEPDQAEWHIDVLRTFNVRDQVKEAALHTWNEGGLVDESFQNSDCLVADCLAWSSWQPDPMTQSCKHSFLAFVANGKLYSSKHQVKRMPETNDTRWTHVQHLVSSQARLTGPLYFMSRSDRLTAFGPDAVHIINLSPLLASDNNTTTHHLDDRWDEISGAALTFYDNKSPQIHIVSHMSTPTTATSSLALPLNSDEVSTPPKWKVAINEAKRVFSNQHNLGGHVQARTWGIASSPLGEYVVTAITLLPSDSISHTIPSDRQTIVNITQEVPFADEDVLQNSDEWEDIVADVRLFHLQRYLGEKPTTNAIQSLVMATIPGSEAALPGAETSENGFEIPDEGHADQKVAWLRHNIFHRKNMAWERNISLTTMALQVSTDGARRSPNIIRRLVTGVLRLDEYLERGGELSDRIRRVYSSLAVKLRAHQQSSAEQVDGALNSETCRICEEPIFFEASRWARCRSGHQFSRCGVSFLAMQEPGFSKHCGICGIQVLNEWKLPGLNSTKLIDTDGSSAPSRNGDDADIEPQRAEPVTSLARILFAAVDACIYCGGKFIA